MESEFGRGTFVTRKREQQTIEREARRINEDPQHRSRAVLLQGPGGVGKTSLLRELRRIGASDDTAFWAEPIDVDDSEYWLLSNLERKVAESLDPGGHYFDRYFEYLSWLPRYTRPRIDHETIISYLGRIKEEFLECYKDFVEDTSRSVVVSLDTMEAIRGTYFLITLTQWMKRLPGTLFILAGRSLALHESPNSADDPIVELLTGPDRSLPVRIVSLGEFTQAEAHQYVDGSPIAPELSSAEKQKLVYLTRGHPLWLALTTDYVGEMGIPDEVDRHSLTELREHLGYKADLAATGKELSEEFRRKLVTPYRETDFWHESIKRLAVVRQRVTQSVWQGLMSDRSLPEGLANYSDAWAVLLTKPWIRPRANFRYVTVHDALAEELAQRMIPWHDQDRAWRRALWERATRIYSRRTVAAEQSIERKFMELDSRLEEVLGRDSRGRDEVGLIQQVVQVDAAKREVDQLRAAQIYYRLLHNYKEGCEEFLTLVNRAAGTHDVLFRELICLEMQRFLPSGPDLHWLDDVIGSEIADFRAWLASAAGGRFHIDIGLSIGRFLVESGQARQAIDVLDSLPTKGADREQRYQLWSQTGNAWMRISRHVKEAEECFLKALEESRGFGRVDRARRIAEVQKELGVYYRNVGLWRQAEEAYRKAHEAISDILSPGSPAEHREEMASIHSNWAYVKALRGHHSEAQTLITIAIDVRRQLPHTQKLGMSLSVAGEVFRYNGKYSRAWEYYREAAEKFEELKDWPWLGLVYQEQAICLFQWAQGSEGLGDWSKAEMVDEAHRLIKSALDLCSQVAVRGYPSALNRAARIVGTDDPEAGLRYLEIGIREAEALADGWFWFANLIEYVELCRRAGLETGDDEHRLNIENRAVDIDRAVEDYDFPELEGRWDILRGHLLIDDEIRSGVWASGNLDKAREYYERGFASLAKEYRGSHGAAGIGAEFKNFKVQYARLPLEIANSWYQELRRAWSLSTGKYIESSEQSTLLIARLQDLV